MNPEIAELACNILSDREFEEAFRLAQIYLQELHVYPFERFFELDDKVGIRLPTHTKYPIEYRSIIRPIKFYNSAEIQHGIVNTCNFACNAFAHLESAAKLLLTNLEPSSCVNQPLGSVLKRLRQLSVSPDLVRKAEDLNEWYVKAKRFWDISEEECLFGQDDAVLIYFAARKIAKQLLDIRGIKIPLDASKY
jgi:hypothetical protein